MEFSQIESEHIAYEVPYSSRQSDSGEAIATAATVGTVLALAMVFWWVFLFTRKASTSRRRPSASPDLASRLLTLVNGDVPTARRLLRNVNRSNPKRSVDWCLEKAIYDLERDRH